MNETSFRFNEPYYLDSFPYSTYNTNVYPIRQQTQSPLNSSNVYFSSSSQTTSQRIHPDILPYSNYDSTYLNVAVAAAYQNNYPNQYQHNTITDPFDPSSFSRNVAGLYGNSNEPEDENDTQQRKSTAQKSKKRKFQDETTSKNISINYPMIFICLHSNRNTV